MRYDADTPITLTAHARPVPSGQLPPRGEVLAEISMSADARDDPSSPTGFCAGHTVTPEQWRLSIAGVSRIVANADAADGPAGRSGLATCRGKFNQPSEKITAADHL